MFKKSQVFYCDGKRISINARTFRYGTGGLGSTDKAPGNFWDFAVPERQENAFLGYKIICGGLKGQNQQNQDFWQKCLLISQKSGKSVQVWPLKFSFSYISKGVNYPFILDDFEKPYKEIWSRFWEKAAGCERNRSAGTLCCFSAQFTATIFRLM